MENLDTLMGKYGEEGDKLIFKILNNGINDPKNIEKSKTAFENILEGRSDKNLTERALRYDLTIPFARYVAMNHGQLLMPYKRYQLQPVWRADRPQKGRYREFYQCDADVVGSNSLLNEVELSIIYATVFEKLGLDVVIKINNRKLLSALAEICGGTDRMTEITIAIDKLDKIGLEKVKEELVQRSLTAAQINIIEQYLTITGSNTEKLQQIKSLIAGTEIGNQGTEELEWILNYSGNSAEAKLEIDFTLARGLNYYTGTIFEVKAKGVEMGSIGGGGRYDDLTGTFGVPNISGVGISFGVDRIYDVLEELALFPAAVQTGTQVLFLNLGVNESNKAFTLMQQLRANGIRAELFHEETKFDKQFKYAEKKNIPYVVIIGNKELADNSCTVKNIRSGEQKNIPQQSISQFNFSQG